MGAADNFQGLLPASKTRPRDSFYEGRTTIILRDAFHLSTWLSIGALTQGLAFLVLGRISLLPAFLYLIYRLLDTYAITTGLRPNPHMSNTVMPRYSAQFPTSTGSYGNTPCNNSVSVLLIGTRCNNPLGMTMDRQFKILGQHMAGMTSQLAANATEYNYLGGGSFIGMQRATNNTIMSVMYFKSAADVQAYSNGPLHRDAMVWWGKIVKDNPQLSIWHELYQVPRGMWESIYMQCEPLGVAATKHFVPGQEKMDGEDEETGQRGGVWMSPVVEASKGILKSSVGRMGKNLGQEEEKVGV